MDVIVVLLSAVSLAAWIHLIGFRGAFWRADQRLEPSLPPPPWPGVVAIIPARDEAGTIEAAPRVVAKVEWHPGDLYPRVGMG